MRSRKQGLHKKLTTSVKPSMPSTAADMQREKDLLNKTRQTHAIPPTNLKPENILALQRTIRNRNVQRLLAKSGEVQPKLDKINNLANKTPVLINRQTDAGVSGNTPRDASLPAGVPGPAPFNDYGVPVWDDLPQYAKDNLGAFKNILAEPNEPNYKLRLTVLNLYVKLKALGFWSIVGSPKLEEGKEGQFNFTCPSPEGLWSTLQKRGDFEMGGKATENWNAREKKDAGALHFKRFGSIMQAHIDMVGYYHTGNTMRTIILALRHVWNYSSYQDVFGIRNLLLSEGWDPVVLKGVQSTGGRSAKKGS